METIYADIILHCLHNYKTYIIDDNFVCIVNKSVYGSSMRIELKRGGIKYQLSCSNEGKLSKGKIPMNIMEKIKHLCEEQIFVGNTSRF